MSNYGTGAGNSSGACFAYGDFGPAMTVQEIITENSNLRKLNADLFETMYAIGTALGLPTLDDQRMSDEEKKAAWAGKLSDKVRSLRKENFLLQNDVIRWQKFYDEMADLAGSLEEQRDTWQASSREWQKKYDVAMKEVSTVEAKLSEGKTYVLHLETEISRLREQRYTWQKKVDIYCKALRAAELKIEETQKRVSELHALRERLNSQVSEMSFDCLVAEKDAARFREQRDEWQRKFNIASTAAPDQQKSMTEAQIRYMVDRFLSWKLPENFCPDAGISFKATFNEHTPHPMKHQPCGTNLFDADQADVMVRYLIDGLPTGDNPIGMEEDTYAINSRQQPSQSLGTYCRDYGC